MINLPEGTIDLDGQNIFVSTDHNHIKNLCGNRLVEQRKDPGGSAPYFYCEAMDLEIRFGVIISIAAGKIEWLLLRWLDGPCTSKGWGEVSEKRLKDEYSSLLNFVETKVGRVSDNKKSGERTWQFKWGKINVSYEPRSFETVIFILPRLIL